MRLFLADDGDVPRPASIICENDVMLHNEFVRASRPSSGTCRPARPIARSAIWWAAGIRRSPGPARRPGRRNLCRMVPWALYGMHMHWISPPYAREVLERWGDLEVDQLPSIPEEIAWGTGGFASYPALAIQEAIDSTIRPPEELDFHISGQAPWALRRLRLGRGGGAVPVGRRALAPANGGPLHDRPRRGRGDRALPGLRRRPDRFMDDLRHGLNRRDAGANRGQAGGRAGRAPPAPLARLRRQPDRADGAGAWERRLPAAGRRRHDAGAARAGSPAHR